jgi:hypothetical protein
MLRDVFLAVEPNHLLSVVRVWRMYRQVGGTWIHTECYENLKGQDIPAQMTTEDTRDIYWTP